MGVGVGSHTKSLMGFEPMVRTRWQASWIRKTVTRREIMACDGVTFAVVPTGGWCRERNLLSRLVN